MEREGCQLLEDRRGVTVRRGGRNDLKAIEAIQGASPEAAQWNPTDYLEYDLWMADREGEPAGFLVSRTPVAGECEILNLAVAPEHRRKGVARSLLRALCAGFRGTLYLEVRASNEAAQHFYKSFGFDRVTIRPEYYREPLEPAIVMKFHSC